MQLTEYKKKRNFKNTPEPKGKKATKSSTKLRYVIQKHHASHLHYDFRLELNGVLLSWAVPKGPCLNPSIKRLAVHVEDHPLAYQYFEGTIPVGEYGAGTVIIWDKGVWESLDPDANKAYQNGEMTFNLIGEKLQGKWKLIRINKNDKTWLLIKGKDNYAKPLNKFDREKEVPEIKKHCKKITKDESFPKLISPELATLVSEPPTGKNWAHEIKWDGYRIIAYKKNGTTKLISRNKNNWTNKFLSIAKAIDKLPQQNLILDGEVVVLDENSISNFQLLQNAIKNKESHFIYYIFDLLYLDDQNTQLLPLLDRKKLLKAVLPKKHSILRYSDHILGAGKTVFNKSCRMELEGIVSKNIRSTYQQKRTQDWLKTKCVKRASFIIVGFTPPKNKRSHFGSLLLADYNDKNQLIYYGHVGTGFTESSLKTTYQKLVKLITPHPSLTHRPPGAKKVTWVKPQLKAEVEFVEFTNAGILRHPSFKGIKANNSSNQLLEKPKMKGTHLDKILFPEDNITKKDLIEYYETIYSWMLPYIVNRPLTLVRCPSEYAKCFYQRHEANKKSYIYLSNKEELLQLAQLNTIEIHPWGSQINSLDYPDVMIFDLDPGEEVEWKTLVKAAKEIRKELAALKLKSYIKTTGGKGLHIVIPIKPEHSFDKVKLFTKTFVDYLAKKYPNVYINKMSKFRRKGLIFVDYLRNQQTATAIAPYSIRAKLHAPVATPIRWDELTNHKEDTFYTLRTLPKRLKKLKTDPWQGYHNASKLIIKK